ncbi:MAG: tRNA pseudouridine(38-40) synthase TruA [Cardiobacteriaceae bacterium]|nr:tRNA pseudouridine(38-40) synthase TruA [Cardiobacteriaceae bacterium]
MNVQRYAAGVEYDGSEFSGWQRQPFFARTIQQAIETALAKVADHAIDITCAGRTDAGVHALGQVFHFESPARRAPYAWLAGGNRYLPPAIRLQWVQPVPADFHARYSAQKRTYRYLILNQGQPSALWRQRLFWHPYPLDIERMCAAAECLHGEHDFSAFRAAECQSSTPFRFIERIDIARDGRLIRIDITGNAFLHHMIRNIVGTLLPIGDGRKAPETMATILASRNRSHAGMTAPAHGLYFMHACYPREFALPEAEILVLS